MKRLKAVGNMRSILIWTMVVCFFAGIGRTPKIALAATTPQQKFQLALEYLAQQTNSISTMYTKFNWVQWDTPEEAKKSGFPSQISKRVCTYITAGKKCRYEEELRFGEAKELVDKNILVYDGTQYKTYHPFTKQGSIVQEGAPRLSFFELVYVVNKGNIAEFLATHAKDITPFFINDGQGKQLLLLKFAD